jgi:hypothetical protein
MADIAGRIRGAFADASFAPYGLDDRWRQRPNVPLGAGESDR